MLKLILLRHGQSLWNRAAGKEKLAKVKTKKVSMTLPGHSHQRQFGTAVWLRSIRVKDGTTNDFTMAKRKYCSGGWGSFV